MVALALVTVLHMVLGEMVPKKHHHRRQGAALALGPPMVKVVAVLKPFIWFFNTTANGFVRLFGVTPTDEVSASFDSSEIRSMITRSRSQGLLGVEVSELAAGALSFETHDARSVLLPSADLVTVHRGITPRELEAVVAEHGFSRYPVCGPDGSWTGFVHVKDALGATDRDSPPPAAASSRSSSCRPTSRCPRCCRRCAGPGSTWPVLADGEVIGVVAMEDMLEQLIGDVRDAAVEPSAPAVGSGAGGR